MERSVAEQCMLRRVPLEPNNYQVGNTAASRLACAHGCELRVPRDRLREIILVQNLNGKSADQQPICTCSSGHDELDFDHDRGRSLITPNQRRSSIR